MQAFDKRSRILAGTRPVFNRVLCGWIDAVLKNEETPGIPGGTTENMALHERLVDGTTLPGLLEVALKCPRSTFISSDNLIAVERFKEHAASVDFEATLGIIEATSVRLNPKTAAAIITQCMNKLHTVVGYQWDLVEINSQGLIGLDSALVLCLFLLEIWLGNNREEDDDRNKDDRQLDIITVIEELYNVYKRIRNVEGKEGKEGEKEEQDEMESVRKILDKDDTQDASEYNTDKVNPNKAVSVLSLLFTKIAEHSNSSVFLNGADCWLLLEGQGYSIRDNLTTPAGHYCQCLVKAQLKLIHERTGTHNVHDKGTSFSPLTDKQSPRVAQSIQTSPAQQQSQQYSFIKRQTPSLSHTTLESSHTTYDTTQFKASQTLTSRSNILTTESLSSPELKTRDELAASGSFLLSAVATSGSHRTTPQLSKSKEVYTDNLRKSLRISENQNDNTTAHITGKDRMSITYINTAPPPSSPSPSSSLSRVQQTQQSTFTMTSMTSINPMRNTTHSSTISYRAKPLTFALLKQKEEEVNEVMHMGATNFFFSREQPARGPSGYERTVQAHESSVARIREMMFSLQNSNRNI